MLLWRNLFLWKKLLSLAEKKNSLKETFFFCFRKVFSNENSDRNLFLWWKLVFWRKIVTDINCGLTETCFCDLNFFSVTDICFCHGQFFCHINFVLWQKLVLSKILFLGLSISDFKGFFFWEMGFSVISDYQDNHFVEAWCRELYFQWFPFFNEISSPSRSKVRLYWTLIL